MAISFENAFGIHEQALKARTQRAEIIANNLANADTPHFKARDIDFKHMLQQQQQMRLNATRSGHISISDASSAATEMYRVPSQASLDGNTVETEQEMARFAKNNMDFQASFTFMNSRIRGLMNALRGE
ncbi:MAG: flagellar basal body rod protein FlgB [Pseudomonadales bacterium]